MSSAVALVVYLALCLAAGCTALDFTIPWGDFQLLPEAPLRERLWESLYHLHGQPPLFNLALGCALVLQSATGIAAETTLLCGHLLLGAAVVWALCELVAILIHRTWLRRLALSCLLLDPVLYTEVFQFSYELWELCFLALFAVAAARYWQHGRRRTLVAACASVAGLTLTRSLFHPVFAAAALCWLVAATPRPRGTWVILAATFAVILAWPLKNRIEFGFFGCSSWLGLNLTHDTDIERPPVAPAFQYGEDDRIRAARDLAVAAVPPRYRDIPVLAEIRKAPEIPNWNHFAIIELSRELSGRAWDQLLERPGRLFERASRSWRRGFCVFAGRHPYEGRFDPRVRESWMGPWMRGYEILAVQYPGDDTRRRATSGFRVVFPLALGLAVWVAWRTRRNGGRARVDNRLVWLLLGCAVWVLLMVLLVDGREGNRLRYSTGFALFLPLVWSLERLFGDRRTSEAT